MNNPAENAMAAWESAYVFEENPYEAEAVALAAKHMADVIDEEILRELPTPCR